MQLVRVTEDYRKLQEVKKNVAKGSGDFARVQMCQCGGSGGFVQFVEEVIFDMVFKLIQLQFDTLIFNFSS